MQNCVEEATAMQNSECGNNPRNDRQRAAGPLRQQVQRAREKWVDVERRIRQRMRIFPQKLRGAMNARSRQEREIDESDLRLPPGGSEPSLDPETNQTQRRPIVSIHGRDLEESESEHPVAS
jgi:hypothetical protein